MSECKKRNCSYYWRDEDEAYPCCHYDDPRFPAPCEEVDEDWEDDSYVEEYESDDNLEMGFDPYEGGYTWDC